MARRWSLRRRHEGPASSLRPPGEGPSCGRRAALAVPCGQRGNRAACRRGDEQKTRAEPLASTWYCGRALARAAAIAGQCPTALPPGRCGRAPSAAAFHPCRTRGGEIGPGPGQKNVVAPIRCRCRAPGLAPADLPGLPGRCGRCHHGRKNRRRPGRWPRRTAAGLRGRATGRAGRSGPDGGAPA
jgi:hypothetical protein